MKQISKWRCPIGDRSPDAHEALQTPALSCPVDPSAALCCWGGSFGTSVLTGVLFILANFRTDT